MPNLNELREAAWDWKHNPIEEEGVWFIGMD